MTDRLEIAVRIHPDGVELHLAGEFAYGTADRLRKALAGLPLRADQTLGVDLAEVTFCDSAGLAALVAARNHATAAGAETVLTGVPAATLRVMRLNGLAEVFALRTAPDS